MKPVIMLADAEDEMNSAKYYYESRSYGLGFDFIFDIGLSTSSIQNFPERWPMYRKNIHKYTMQKYPYIIYYLIEETQITILAVSHQKRKPNYWKKRIP